jgi:hypothetical protein
MRIVIGDVPNEKRAKARLVCDDGVKLLIPPCETVLKVRQAGSDGRLNFLTGFGEFISGIIYAHRIVLGKRRLEVGRTKHQYRFEG